MGVYIKGMDKPKNCDECWNKNLHAAINCDMSNWAFRGGVSPTCPIISVPVPHGHLVDIDDLQYGMLKGKVVIEAEEEQMDIICDDNRFEIIETAKAHLLEATNIDTSPDEMKVLDNFLFRCWQMGWLSRYDHDCENCRYNGEICGRCRYYSLFAEAEAD